MGIFNSASEEFIEVEEMPGPVLRGHVCGLSVSSSGRTSVIVTAGISLECDEYGYCYNNYYQRTTHVFDVATGHWHSGPPFPVEYPEPLYTLPYKSSFIVVPISYTSNAEVLVYNSEHD